MELVLAFLESQGMHCLSFFFFFGYSGCFQLVVSSLFPLCSFSLGFCFYCLWEIIPKFWLSSFCNQIFGSDI